MLRLRFQGKMLAAFGVVLGVFVAASVVTLLLSGASQSKWDQTTHWEKAMTAASEQIDGTHTQLAAQALYVATGDERYKREWEQGVKKVESSTKVVAGLGLAEVTRIAKSAEASDAKHDAAVHDELFPAMAAGDQAAALHALRKADRYVRVPLAAQDRIAGVVARARGRRGERVRRGA